MAKNPTNWSNNDVKPASSWANNDVKAPAAWANNDVKTPTAFTGVAKNTDQWGPHFQSPQGWQYNDPTIPYDSPLYQFNFRVNKNTDNQRLVTKWQDSGL